MRRMDALAKKMTPWIVATALFMETLDSSIISTAIPKMALDFHIDPINLKVALTCYLLALAIFIPISGWVADKFGTKKTFLSAISLFTVSSLLCGLSHNLMELVFARVLQGIGGALMTPVGRLILVKTFSKSELLRAMTFVTIPGLIGPTLGPVVGGFITTFFSWEWIFYVNIPVGIFGGYLARRYILDYQSAKVAPFDILGFLILGLSLAGLAFGFESIGQGMMSVHYICVLLAAAFTALLAYAWYARSIPHPAVDLRLFSVRTFRINVLGGFCCRLGLGGTPFLLPLLFQIGFGLLPIYSGLLISPIAIAMLSIKPWVKKILARFGFKKTLIVNACLVSVSIMSLALINRTTPYGLIVLLTLIYGLLSSLQFSCMNVLTYVDLDSKDQSTGTSIASTMMQLSWSFGIGLAALWMRIFSGPEHRIIPGHIAPFRDTFLMMGLVVLLSLISFAKLKKTDGASMSGHE